MVQLLTRPLSKRRSATIAPTTEVHELLLVDTAVGTEVKTPQTREPFVKDVAAFISEMQHLLDEVGPSDGLRDSADGLLRKMEADPADPITWGKLRSLQRVLYSSSSANERAQQEPKPLNSQDRAAALMSLKFAENRGDHEAVQILQDALAVGQAAVDTQVESSRQ